MKYNVGICLYGLPRVYKVCQKYNDIFFNQIGITPYYFCHGWNTVDLKYDTSYNASDDIKNIIKPVSLQHEVTKECVDEYCRARNISMRPEVYKRIKGGNFHSVSQFVSLEKSVQLLLQNLENIPKLDFIITKRYDVAFNYRPVGSNLEKQIQELKDNPSTPIVYQPILHNLIVDGYSQASCYYFLTNLCGAKTLAEDFGENAIRLASKVYDIENANTEEGYLNNSDSVRNKHMYWLQQYLNDVEGRLISPNLQHSVVRNTCTMQDTFEDVLRKFI